MYGDETWLKLFPGLFTRHDGVSSFFVSICILKCGTYAHDDNCLWCRRVFYLLNICHSFIILILFRYSSYVIKDYCLIGISLE